jgi:hypothetical protein
MLRGGGLYGGEIVTWCTLCGDTCGCVCVCVLSKTLDDVELNVCV